MISSRSRLAAILAGAIALTVAIGAPAEARRGGSFGSRGMRTYTAPRPTYSSPGYVAPVQRSMTAPPAGYAPGQPSYAPQPAYGPSYGYGAQPRYRPGFGGGLLTGLATGGLIGALMGHGWGYGGGWGGGMGMGGMGGMGLFAALFQLALLGFAVWFAVRLFRRRNGAPQPVGFPSAYDAGAGYAPGAAPGPWGAAPGPAPGPWGAAAPAEISVAAADLASFERLLIEVQDAFGREDYGALRERTTPEVMSYLAEELSENATHGRRNDVTRTRLLRSDVSEAWREGDADYATVALNYESVDVMRDRQSGQVMQGDPNTPTSTTELWTFVRRGGGPWKLSAIQET
jgi:predicted lipid-binding transport protein (Tim44 family)